MFLENITQRMIMLNNICCRYAESIEKDKNQIIEECSKSSFSSIEDKSFTKYQNAQEIKAEYEKTSEIVYEHCVVLVDSEIKTILKILHHLIVDKEYIQPSKYIFPALRNMTEIRQIVYALIANADKEKLQISKRKTPKKCDKCEEKYIDENKIDEEKKKIVEHVNNNYKEILSALDKIDKIKTIRNSFAHGTASSALRSTDKENKYTLKNIFGDVKELLSAIESELLPKIKEPERNWESLK
jgi:hypothetical protein